MAGGVVFVGSDDGNLYALDASTGARKWEFGAGYSIDSSPAAGMPRSPSIAATGPSFITPPAGHECLTITFWYPYGGTDSRTTCFQVWLAL